MATINPRHRQLILQTMVSMASADGDIDAGETATIRRAYADETSEDISADEVTEAVQSYRAGSGVLTSALSNANADMDQATKESLLRASYMVLLADGRIAARERKKLHNFADALKISEIHLSVILEDVSR